LSFSRSATYEVSSQLDEKYPPLPALLAGEGKLHNFNQRFAFHTADPDPHPHIVITLPKTSTVTRCEISNTLCDLQWVLNRARGLTLWASVDKIAWKELWRSERVSREWTVELATPIRARFIKIGLPRADMLHLSGVKIHGHTALSDAAVSAAPLSDVEGSAWNEISDSAAVAAKDAHDREVRSAAAVYEAAMRPLRTRFRDRAVRAKKRLLKSLDAVLQRLTRSRDLDGAIAVRDTTAHIRSDLERLKSESEAGAEHWVSKDATYELSSMHTNWPPLPALLTGEGKLHVSATKFAFHTGPSDPAPHIIVTLKQPSAVTRFEILNTTTDVAHFRNRAEGLTVWVSSDKKTWHRIWQAGSAQDKWNVKLNSPTPSVSYIKIGLPGKGVLHLVGVRIFGR